MSPVSYSIPTMHLRTLHTLNRTTGLGGGQIVLFKRDGDAREQGLRFHSTSYFSMPATDLLGILQLTLGILFVRRSVAVSCSSGVACAIWTTAGRVCAFYNPAQHHL